MVVATILAVKTHTISYKMHSNDTENLETISGELSYIRQRTTADVQSIHQLTFSETYAMTRKIPFPGLFFTQQQQLVLSVVYVLPGNNTGNV